MLPIYCSQSVWKIPFSSDFLKMLSHLAFIDGTFTKADAIRSTAALQQPLTIYDTAFNKILY